MAPPIVRVRSFEQKKTSDPDDPRRGQALARGGSLQALHSTGGLPRSIYRGVLLVKACPLGRAGGPAAE